MVEYDFVKVPIVDIVNQIILYAAQHRASDIHFDPLEDALMVRMRVDGDLQNHSLVPKVYERNLICMIHHFRNGYLKITFVLIINVIKSMSLVGRN